MMFDRRLVEYFDWGLLGITLVLGSIGIVTLYSAVIPGTLEAHKMLYIKQLIWYSAGFVVMTVCFVFSYRNLDQWSHIIYAFSMILLVMVLVFGKVISGSQRWLALGPISIQPSEIAKIAVIIALAKYYSRHTTKKGFSLKELAIPFFITAVPFVLIVREPDLGTAMLVALISGTITMFVKIERKSKIILIGAGSVTVLLGWFFLLKEYQIERIKTFLNPDRNPLGAGYHIIQSKIAIGSGMVSGKGFLKGTQNALSFLPEQHTDFIFSVLAEQWGFVGSMSLILLFMLLIFWGLNVAYASRDPFGTILAVGVSAMIFWQVFINIGMVMGLMPVVGVPLPFISYGGSSLLTVMAGTGILLNVSMRRFMFE